MHDKVKEYINESLKKESDVWREIAKEKSRQHPNESVRQIIIRTMVQCFETKFPDVMSELDVEIKKKRELAKNEHAANTDNDMRQVTAIPDGLSVRIDRVFSQSGWPRFLSKEADQRFDELNWFLKTFPRFLVPNVY